MSMLYIAWKILGKESMFPIKGFLKFKFQSSYVQINGTDEFGNRYLRTQVFTILPASIELRIQPVSGKHHDLKQ